MYIKKLLTQTAVNTSLEVAVPTLLTVDGRQGWNLTGFRWNYNNLQNAVASTANAYSILQVNTETGLQTFDDPDNVFYINYLFHGVAASTSAMQIMGSGVQELPEPRTTVQPELYFRLETSGMTIPVTVGVELTYEIVKLTDMEVMRLLQGGA